MAAATATTATTSDYGVAGFDADLLDDKIIAKHLKKLDRATMLAALRRGLVAVRVNALAALEQHGKLGPGDAPSVAVMLKNDSASVRAAAARALACVEDADVAVAALCDATADGEPAVREAVLAAVKSFGAAALPGLIKRMACDPAEADMLVLPHLTTIGEPATKALIAAFGHDDQRVRANAVAGIAALGPAVLVRHQDAVDALRDDRADIVRHVVRDAMNAVYRHSRSSHLPPEPPPVPHFAAQTLTAAEVKRCAKTKVETLHHYARDGRAVARLNAWRCMQALTKLDDYTAALGLVALKDHDPRVRVAACAAVPACADDRLHDTVAGLIRCTLDREVTVRDAAWDALDALKKRSLPILIDLIGERDQAVALKLVEAVTRHGAGAAKSLHATLDHVGPIERWNAVLALIAIGGKTLEGAFEKLLEMLKDPFDATRAVVVKALGKLPGKTKGRPDAVAVIEYMLEYDASLAVRSAADVALRAIAASKARK